MGVFRAEAGHDDALGVGLAIAIGILEEGHAGLLAAVDAAIAKLEAERDVQAGGEDGALVGLAVMVGVLKDDDLVVGLLSWSHLRIRRGAGNPQASAGVPAHLDGLCHFRKLLLAREEIYLEARIHTEGGEFTFGLRPFVDG